MNYFSRADGKRTFMRRLIASVACCVLLQQAASASADDTLDLSAHEGKVVIVDFWASWCVPCRRSFPWLNSMYDRYGEDGLVIIGVNLDQERTAADEFLHEFPAKFSIHYDVSKELAKSYGVVAMPTSYLVGRDGAIRKTHYGFKVKKQDEYESAIVEALTELE